MAITSEDVFAELSEGMGAGLMGDPYPIFAERRRTSPIMVGDIMSEEFGLPAMAASMDGSRPMFTFFRYDDVVAALRDPETFSSSVINEVFEPIVGRTVLGMDGEEHRKRRGLYMPAFTRRLVEMWQERVMRPVARSMVQRVAASPDKRANLVDLALRYPVRMIYQIIGLPPDEELYDEFARGALMVGMASQGLNPADPEENERVRARALAVAQETYEKILEIVCAKRAAGTDGDDLISRLLRVEFEGEHMGDEEVARFIRTLLTPASETTTRSWLNVMTLLLHRPEVLEEVRNDRSLILPAIDEGMRVEPVAVVLGRITTREVEVRGVKIPAKAGITLVTGSANRDEEVFERADEFDLHRESAKATLVFGHGPHLCPGMNTARMEMREAIDALLDELPDLRLDQDAAPPEIRGVMLRSPAALHVTWS